MSETGDDGGGGGKGGCRAKSKNPYTEMWGKIPKVGQNNPKVV